MATRPRRPNRRDPAVQARLRDLVEHILRFGDEEMSAETKLMALLEVRQDPETARQTDEGWLAAPGPHNRVAGRLSGVDNYCHEMLGRMTDPAWRAGGLNRGFVAWRLRVL